MVKDRLLKKTDDLEVRLEKAHAEIKRLRTLYKTAQKAMEAQRPTTAAEREKQLAEAAKRPMRISKQVPLVNQMSKVFEGEHALLELLLQAREDGDADEIARMTMRCRAVMILAGELEKTDTLEGICMAVLDYLPTVMECEYCILQIYEDETNMYWTVPRRNGGRGYFPMSKKSLAYVVFKSKEPLYINDANINSLFNIDLECDGVFGSIDTRCVLSVPVIASSINHSGNQNSGPQFSKSLAHRKRTLELEKQQRVVGVLQAFNKRLRQNTGLHADDVIAQAHAASFDKVDGDIMRVCCNMLRGHIKRVEALLTG